MNTVTTKEVEKVNERVRFAAGRIASKREELAHLRELAEQARLNHERYTSHYSEIEKAKAEQRLADFLDENPGLVG